jgi:outer membrane lipoprotein-sorting protein
MRRPRLLELAAVALIAAGCAKAAPPPPEVARAAAVLTSYSGSLRVSVRGEDLRGRSRALVAFRRPDALRIEIPGATGARLLAVVAGGRLTAVLPADRAVLQREASSAELEALLGIALTPEELMDLLVGIRPVSARDYRVRWGRTLPRRIEAELADGTRLGVSVDEAESGVALPAAAFEPPPHEGYRPTDADAARRLLGGR